LGGPTFLANSTVRLLGNSPVLKGVEARFGRADRQGATSAIWRFELLFPQAAANINVWTVTSVVAAVCRFARTGDLGQ
jgi:hypothetical protein